MKKGTVCLRMGMGAGCSKATYNTALVWCTSTASLQQYKAFFMWLSLTPAKEHFLMDELILSVFLFGGKKSVTRSHVTVLLL